LKRVTSQSTTSTSCPLDVLESTQHQEIIRVPLALSACLLGPVHTPSAHSLWIPYLESPGSNELTLVSHSKLFSLINQTDWYHSLCPSSWQPDAEEDGNHDEEGQSDQIIFAMKIKFSSFVELQRLHDLCVRLSSSGEGDGDGVSSNATPKSSWKDRCVSHLNRNGLQFLKMKLSQLQRDSVVTLGIVTQLLNEKLCVGKDLERILRELTFICIDSLPHFQNAKLLEATVRDSCRFDELMICDGVSVSTRGLPIGSVPLGVSCHFASDALTFLPSSDFKQLIAAHEWCLVSPQEADHWKDTIRKDLWNVLQIFHFPSEFLPRLLLLTPPLLQLNEMSFHLEIFSPEQEQQEKQLIVTMCFPQMGAAISQMVLELSVEEKQHFMNSLTIFKYSSPTESFSLDLWMNQVLSYVATVSYLVYLSHHSATPSSQY
jgi:hypothetical protein